MAIDFQSEHLIPFAAVPRLPRLPSRRRGARLAISTIHRWRHPGVRGVRLEAIRCGGTWCTTAEALQRFFDRLGAAAEQPRQGASHQRGRDLSAVDQALDSEGIG
jgi:Protein of unknown function (DUF1580)